MRSVSVTFRMTLQMEYDILTHMQAKADRDPESVQGNGMSQFVRMACKEKLDHLARSNKPRRSVKRTTKPDDDIEIPDPDDVQTVDQAA